MTLAVVTGGESGIGAACAQRIAELGADIVISVHTDAMPRRRQRATPADGKAGSASTGTAGASPIAALNHCWSLLRPSDRAATDIAVAASAILQEDQTFHLYHSLEDRKLARALVRACD